MRRLLSFVVVSLVCGEALVAAQDASRDAEERLIGVWSGAWTGDSSGTYTMTIVRDKTNKLGGSLQTMPEGGEGGKAVFKSVVVDAARAILKYDTIGDTPSEVTLEAAVDGKAIKGTWQVADPAAKTVSSRGTFTGTKK